MCVQKLWLLQPGCEAVKFSQQREKTKATVKWKEMRRSNKFLMGGVCIQRPNLTSPLQPGRTEGPLLPAVGTPRTASLGLVTRAGRAKAQDFDLTPARLRRR